MQLQRKVKGNLRLLPSAVTAENAPFTNQSRCTFRFLRSFEIASTGKEKSIFMRPEESYAGFSCPGDWQELSLPDPADQQEPLQKKDHGK